MPLFWKPYKSDISNFIDELKAKKPTLEAEQFAGRSLLWDKPVDREAQAEYGQSRVPQQPYVYQTRGWRRRPDAPVKDEMPAGARAALGESAFEPAADDGAAARSPDRPADASGDTAPAAQAAAPPADADPVALARLYGEPLFALPADLYIPPDALEVFLEAFEGPLDLLLYLIRRQNFDLFDIPLADVTRQYLAYVEQLRRSNLELAGDYLLMAATLIEIKSRLLLPPRKGADGAEEAEDPRAELVRRLLDYERMKRAAARLDALPLAGRDFFAVQVAVERPPVVARFPDVTTADLHAAWRDILARARLVRHHTVTREQLSVREHMSLVLRRLQGRRFAAFEELFDAARGTPVVVVTFVALLELSREQLVEVTQAEAFAPIYVRLAYAA